VEGIVSEGSRWYDGLEPKTFDQVHYIVERFRTNSTRPVTILGERAADGGVHFMHAERQLVVREEYLDHVRRMLGLLPIPDRTFDPATGVRRVTRGVVELTFEPDSALGQRDVPGIVDEIDAELGRGIATPNHVLTVAPEMGPCPASEPQEVEAGIDPYPGVHWENDGAGVLIYIADTGLLKGAEKNHPWLQGVSSERNSHPWLRDVMSEEDELPAKKSVNGKEVQDILGYQGHGTFVAGVTRCMAPRADIIVEKVFDVAGSALETDFVRKLDAALRLGVDIFHLSVTAPTRNDVALVSLQGWMERLTDYQGVACVVPAGNSGTRRPCWPAAFPSMISVGALATDVRTRADFSNYGGWVDVYAPGRDLINAYATGTYTCHVEPYKDAERTFYGMARWSGTSFSSPIVTGLIASRMSQTGENAQQAAAALLAEARAQAIPGVGPVLLP
jgi:subtilisin family serine protease